MTLLTELMAAAIAATLHTHGPLESGFVLAQAAAPLQLPDAPASTTPPPAPGNGTDAQPPASPTPATPAAPPAAGSDSQTPQASPAPGAPQGETTGQPPASGDQQAEPDQGTGEDGDTPNQELSLGEIPVIETMELTPDIAKRAIDAYLMAKEKYASAELDQYENLQEFVDKTPEGKNFEADIKAAGFANVTDWNLAITTLGVIYGTVSDDQTSDIEQQIKEVQDDKELAQDIKDKMVKALKAMIPSANNKKVVEDLMNDPAYGPKLKQLDIEEE